MLCRYWIYTGKKRDTSEYMKAWKNVQYLYDTFVCSFLGFFFSFFSRSFFISNFFFTFYLIWILQTLTYHILAKKVFSFYYRYLLDPHSFFLHFFRLYNKKKNSFVKKLFWEIKGLVLIFVILRVKWKVSATLYSIYFLLKIISNVPSIMKIMFAWSKRDICQLVYKLLENLCLRMSLQMRLFQ